jgi:hypothetical protein
MEIYFIVKYVSAVKYSYSSSEMFASCCIMCVCVRQDHILTDTQSCVASKF